jgi:hypothetical protein
VEVWVELKAVPNKIRGNAHGSDYDIVASVNTSQQLAIEKTLMSSGQ